MPIANKSSIIIQIALENSILPSDCVGLHPVPKIPDRLLLCALVRCEQKRILTDRHFFLY